MTARCASLGEALDDDEGPSPTGPGATVGGAEAAAVTATADELGGERS